ncbi:DUF4232 domain-containing protein [Streptomyces sp. S.PNR 29]|uniref:DUF4232 domain-containing protein n=1 Tax=Streptomyces sp. S.PNR 29 TaxID=2973805 RepID=UPI0025AF0AE6|nr:DUF4232 domain-containing protein [Streptomyces sp. S.PNR 29]MDN0198067.1 DUF4232 domain-containing protein [Streptomyces sp. S.PNR 29]
MRATATPVAVVAALATTLLLSACDDGGGSGGATENSKKSTACVIDDMGVQVQASAAPAAGDTGTVSVTLTNRGSTCTLDGFPSVDLYAGGGRTAVQPNQAAKPRKLTLAKDAAASFTLTYVRGEAGGGKSLAAKTAKFGLPGASATHSFTWSYGDVALKGAEGQPDATVSPFQQAGD